jgi:two-component system OmpR family sensor kinase
MTTLRARLTVWLLGALVLVGSCSALFVYVRAERATQSLLDNQLKQVGQLVAARRKELTVPPTGRSADAASKAAEDLIVTVRDAAGTVRFSTDAEVPLPTPVPGFSERQIGGQRYRIYGMDTGARSVAVAQAIGVRHDAALGGALAALLPVVVLIPVLAIVIGFVVRRGLAPLENAVRSIAERSPLALEAVALADQPEDLRPLIGAMNRLIVRLGESLEHERRFISDAAHALRTPIAALQLQADVLDSCHDADERDRRLQELRAGIDRIVRLTNQLLALAGDERGPRVDGARTPADVLLEEIAGLYAPLAAARGVRVELQPDADADLPGELGRLLLIVGNLFENAVRHSPPGGLVQLRSQLVGSAVEIEVVDEGPGVPAGELERVFERFYRASSATEGGSGLGLATARAIAARLGGRVSLANRTDRSGLVARVWLPVNPAPRPAHA